MRRRFNKNFKFQISNFKFRYGQSLLEVVISVAIAAILAIALVTTTLITQRTSESAKNNTIATKLVQDGIEQIRVFRDRNGYDALINDPVITQSPTCFYIDTVGISPDIKWKAYNTECSQGGEDIRLDNTIYYRKMSIKDVSPPDPDNRKLITVEVTWKDSQGDQSIKSETILSRWEQF